jgi:hypothetical protein
MILRPHAVYRQALWMPAGWSIVNNPTCSAVVSMQLARHRNISSATVGVLGKTPRVHCGLYAPERLRVLRAVQHCPRTRQASLGLLGGVVGVDEDASTDQNQDCLQQQAYEVRIDPKSRDAGEGHWVDL